MFFVPWLGRLSALRSLRVLRALKTVTAVPGELFSSEHSLLDGFRRESREGNVLSTECCASASYMPIHAKVFIIGCFGENRSNDMFSKPTILNVKYRH